MVRPLTWRNINAPQSNPATALGVGVGAFGEARKGFRDLTDFTQDQTDREDERRSNAHIRAALEGNPLPGDNRVNPLDVLKATQSQGRFESDELTARLNQAGQGLENQRSTAELDVFDVNQTANLEGKRASTEASIASTERNRAQVAAIQGTEKRRAASETKMRTVEQRWAAIASDNEAEQENEIQNALGLLRENNPGITDTEVQNALENSIRPAVQARAQQQREQQALTFEADTIKDLGLTKAEWEATTPGGAISGARQLQSEQTAIRRSESKKATEAARTQAEAAASGKFENLIPSGDGFRVANKEEARRNKVSITKSAAVNQVASANRIELNGADQNKALEILQIVGGNRQVFDDAIRSGVSTNYELIGPNFPEITNNGWTTIRRVAKQLASSMRAAGSDLSKAQSRSPGAAGGIQEIVAALTSERNDNIFLASPEGQAQQAQEQAARDEQARIDQSFDYSSFYGR
jgi:hypothetical protein